MISEMCMRNDTKSPSIAMADGPLSFGPRAEFAAAPNEEGRVEMRKIWKVWALRKKSPPFPD